MLHIRYEGELQRFHCLSNQKSQTEQVQLSQSLSEYLNRFITERQNEQQQRANQVIGSAKIDVTSMST